MREHITSPSRRYVALLENTKDGYKTIPLSLPERFENNVEIATNIWLKAVKLSGSDRFVCMVPAEQLYGIVLDADNGILLEARMLLEHAALKLDVADDIIDPYTGTEAEDQDVPDGTPFSEGLVGKIDNFLKQQQPLQGE